MKRFLLVTGLLAIALVLAGCGKSQKITAPVERPGALRAIDPGDGPAFKPGTYFYTWATNRDPASMVFSDLERIDLSTGQGTIVTGLTGLDLAGGDPRGYPCPLGLAFDGRRSMYTIVNWLLGPSNLSQLGRVDMVTGAFTPVGPVFDGNMAGPVMDAQGNLYAVGFSNGPNHEPPDYFVGDQYLYRINKNTGARTRIGDTGLRDIMDLAFDRSGKLYATTMNQLFVVNTVNGHSRKVADLTGVPVNACGIQLEVMSLEFDEDGTLYGTAIEGFAGACWEDTPFLKIDPKTGACTLIGWTGQWYNHGGAILTSRFPV